MTRILSALDAGDPNAAEQLLPLVYDELRRLAAAKLASEKPGQTLQATATRPGAALTQATTGARQAATAHQDLATQITAAGTSLGGFVTRQNESARAVNDTTAAIARQAAGWRALVAARVADEGEPDLAGLVARSDDQLTSLRLVHDAVASRSLG